MPFTGNLLIVAEQWQITDPESSSLIQITESTDWLATYGIDPADVSITLELTRPDNIQTSHAIAVGGATLISAPIDALGAVQEGVYVYGYMITIVGAVDPGNYVKTNTIDWCNECPVMAFNTTIDCNCAPIFIQKDVTPYPNNTTVTTTITSRIITVRDGFGNSYTNVANGDTVTSENDSINAGEWKTTAAVTALLTYSNHTTQCTLTAAPGNNPVPTARFSVDCIQLCNLKCCLDAQYNRAEAACFEGPEQDKFLAAAAIFSIAQGQAQCGDTSNLSKYSAEIKEILNCNEDCDDCSDTSQNGLIVPGCTSTGTTYTFLAGSSSIEVNVLGTTVTYSLTAKAESILAAVKIYNVTSSDGSVTVGTSTSVAVIPTTTFDLTAGNIAPRDSMAFDLSFDLTGALPPTGVISNLRIKSSDPAVPVFQSPTSIVVDAVACGITISGFYVNDALQGGFKVLISDHWEYKTGYASNVTPYVTELYTRTSNATPTREFELHIDRNWPQPSGYWEAWAAIATTSDTCIITIEIIE